jgi:hypothetical protein
MEPVRFADILFILLVGLVTFGILRAVHRKRKNDGKKNGADSAGSPEAKGSSDRSSAPDEDD